MGVYSVLCLLTYIVLPILFYLSFLELQITKNIFRLKKFPKFIVTILEPRQVGTKYLISVTKIDILIILRREDQKLSGPIFNLISYDYLEMLIL